MKKLFGVFVICLIFLGVLWLGGYSMGGFSNAIDMKNPISVFEPTLNKYGLVPENTPPPVVEEKQEDTKQEEPKQEEQSKEEEKNEDTSKEETLSVTKEDLLKLVSEIRVSTHENTEKYNRDDWENWQLYKK